MGTRSPGTPIAPSLSKLKLLGNLAAAYSLDTFFRSTAEKNAAATGEGGGGATIDGTGPKRNTGRACRGVRDRKIAGIGGHRRLAGRDGPPHPFESKERERRALWAIQVLKYI
jgi:hypothetical protein